MLINKINLLQGTDSCRDFSAGNTLPLSARPFGMHHWTFQTSSSPSRFHPSHKKLWGIRLTHQPSPWVDDYGSLLITGSSGHIFDKIESQASAYHLSEAILHPHYLEANLLRYGIQIQMTPTNRGAMFVFTRQTSEPLQVRFAFDGNYSIHWERSSDLISGISHNHSGGVAGQFGLHFAAKFDHEPTDFIRTADGGVVIFPALVDRIELRVSGSFISQELAVLALERELSDRSFTELTKEAENSWVTLLERIRIIGENSDQEDTFYSCLYRTLLFPRFLDELNAEGQVIHYSPYTGKAEPGSLCTDNGFWDTFRTVYPLFALVYPDKLRLMLDGWLNTCRESGWTPKWASPGARDFMSGTYFDVVVADAVAKGIIDWNIEDAFKYLLKDATEPSPNSSFGRPGLEDYLKLGYVPCDKYPYSVSATLDYCYGDYCISTVARHLGKNREADSLEKRGMYYRNLFDPTVGFMRGRRSDGNWETPFREFGWGGSYIEGGPWQHTFHVPHDPSGLIQLFGSPQSLCAKLDAMLATPPRFDATHYGTEIHEMTEMTLTHFGQYAQSNQPVHGYLFLYALAGAPEKTNYWVPRICSELYSKNRLPGDEDNGEMSAWYVFASLGLFPHCPGKPEYVRSTPLVRSAEISVPGRQNTIRIGKPYFSDQNKNGITINHHNL